MIRTSILIISFWFSFSFLFAQGKAVFIVDSITVSDEPNPELNNLKAQDIHSLKVITDKTKLKDLGLSGYDTARIIITKAYHNRPGQIKKIPSINDMENIKGKWYLKEKNQPYTGPFINYYLSGDKYGEGSFKDGRLDGLRKMYYDNGNLKLERRYKDGVENGISKEFFEDGTLKQSGEFIEGYENGKWEMYYPNGQLRKIGQFKRGKLVGETTTYYSTGRLKNREEVVDGKIKQDPEKKKIFRLYDEGYENAQLGNLKAAIKSFTKCIEMDPYFAEAYFARGTARLNNMQFEKAQDDYDKALEIEPFYLEAYANRAFCLIRKYQLKDSKSKKKTLTDEPTKDHTKIPAKDLEIICSDLGKTISLGNSTQLILGAYRNYCE